jgi:hypothetical protein
MELDPLEAAAFDRADPAGALQIAAGGAQALERQHKADSLDVELEASAPEQSLEQSRQVSVADAGDCRE